MSRSLTHEMRVRFAECDPQGIVFNARYLEYFDVAMTEIWREAIGPYEQATADAGVDLVVAEAGVRYLDSLRFDDLFELRATVSRIGTTSMTTPRLRGGRPSHVAVPKDELSQPPGHVVGVPRLDVHRLPPRASERYGNVAAKPVPNDAQYRAAQGGPDGMTLHGELQSKGGPGWAVIARCGPCLRE